jgi:hypothetical protein
MFEGRGVAGVPDGFPQIPALVQRGKKRMIRFFDFWNRKRPVITVLQQY